MQQLSSRALQIKEIISEFINNRLITKIDALSADDPKFQIETEKHQYLTWLESAVNRVSQIQVVTHPLKATYPLAHIKETTSLYCRPKDLPQHSWLSTASLTTDFIDDVTGNAAALDIYALLQQQAHNCSLLELCLNKDPDLLAALHPEPATAQHWLDAFADVTQPKMEGIASHTFAKQLYWLDENANVEPDPYSDQDYLLLSPLYSSSLAHAVYDRIEADRFGQEAKDAREAERTNKSHPEKVRYYPNLAVQIIGGANPQGVSSLSSKRRGTNYLLPSLPPSWQQQKSPPFHVQSIFQRFEKLATVKEWLTDLQSFLAADPQPNLKTRQQVSYLVNGLIGELHLFALDIQQLPANWSADPLCNLPVAQCFWLDPQRSLQDHLFAEQWLTSNWDEAIEHDFSRWLNQALGKKVSYLGDIEFKHWAKQLRQENQWQYNIKQHTPTKKQMSVGSTT